MKYSKKVEKQALFWYVRIQSPDFSQQQESDFFNWLEASCAHQAAFLRVEQAWQAGGSFREVKIPAKPIWAGWHYWAGACAVLLVGLAVFLNPFNSFGRPETKLFSTAAGELKSIALEDGSSINMRAATSIAVSYAQEQRRVQLSNGSIFLSVTKDSSRPFIVDTARGAVTVIGTQFEIDSVAEDIAVTVLEGRVGLLDSEKKSTTPFVILEKNQRISFSKGLAGGLPESVDASTLTSWTKGRLVFDGIPLSQVIVAVNEYLATPIVIGNSVLENKRIVGAISIKDPMAAAKSLAQISGAEVEVNPAKTALILK